ncbi:MAG TPA: hypothetical protein VIG30_13745 [Ktedonobacterales bacterium]
MRVIATARALVRARQTGPQRRIHSVRTHPARGAFASAGVVVVFLAALALAACGASSPGASGGGNCGAVHSGAGGAFAQGTSATVDCFWQAYSHCQSATLTFTEMGVDTSSTHTLTIKPGSNGTCSVSDAVSFFQASGGFHSTHNYQCSGMRQSSGGLVAEQCGTEGNVVIPAPNGTPAPTTAP